MRLRQIEVFHAIYTTGSITNAANLLCVSQPSVSKVLSHSEMQLGFTLFERNKGKILPTAEADILFPKVEKIYQQLYSIKKLSSNIKRRELGSINIAVTPALGFNLIPRAIAKFKTIHPKVEFELHTSHNEDAARALLEHKCNLALLYESPTMPQIKEITVGESEIVIVFPTSLFPDRPEKMDAQTFLQNDVIDVWSSGPLGELVWNRINKLDIPVKSSIKVDTYYIAANLVAQGLGCCTIDRLTAEANKSSTVGIASFYPPINFNIKALFDENNPISQVSQEFLKFIKAELDNPKSQ